MFIPPPKNKVVTMVHGDDFVSVGRREQIEEFEGWLKDRFEIKTKKVGMDCDLCREARVLNRIVRVTDRGWEYEADQRHAEMIVKEMGLELAKPVATPGEEEKQWEAEENKVILDASQATKYRRIAARLNYLAMDRVDLMYCTKEICRHMATPTIGAWRKLGEQLGI